MFGGLSDAAVVDGMAAAVRAESAEIARRLALIGELDARRTVELAETVFWRTDPFEEVAAEVSAALSISRSRAGSQIHYARALRDKLPHIAALFATGAIDFRVVTTIIARTANVAEQAWPALDKVLADHAAKWMRLSDPKLRDRVDLWVAKHDPDAVRVPPAVDDARHLTVEPASAGTAAIWGNLRAADAAGFDKRLDALAATVCENAPRTRDQLRADACGALGRLQERLDCHCDSPDCPAAGECRAAASVVIHVLADQATLDGTSNQPGYLPGFGVLPAESVRDLAGHAKLQPLTVPEQPQRGYRPSVALAEFVRWRDLTCRFPGCDAPAQRCDIDHTVPYPQGPTHPSNTKTYCRAHHLIKTFCPGWSDRQYPDGTIVFTAPTGHTYTTEPHGAALFPILGQPTGDLTIPEPHQPGGDRSVMMPKRRHTREQDQQHRINAERRERAELNAEQQRQHQQWLDTNAEPPPF